MKSRRLMLMMVVGVSTSLACFAEEDLFPPMVFHPRSEFDDAMVRDHMTIQLRALKESSLWTTSRQCGAAHAYRILWLASSRHPICVRVTKEGDTVTTRVSRHDGWPGVVAGKLSMERIEPLSLKQWDRLAELVEKSKFWTAPAEVEESNGIADGDGLFIEGVKNGTYHVVDRAGSTTGESYKNIGRYMLELARDGDAIHDWDRRRESERKSPDYRPEPPETPDLGVPDYLLEGFFSDLSFFPGDRDHDQEERDDKAQRLWKLKQRSLWTIGKDDGSVEAYRASWWTEDGDSVCVRVVKKGEMIDLHLVELDPDTGAVVVDAGRKLTSEQWASLAALAEKMKLWTAPVEVRPDAERARFDVVLVEGVLSGRIHVVERRCGEMDWRIKDFCRRMLELAESKAVATWDRWRDRERDDPNYHFEPPQVPDLVGPPYRDE